MAAAPFDKSDYSPFQAFAFEQVSVAGTAVGFTAATYNPSGGGGPAKMAVCCVEVDAIRSRVDAAPTASVGMPWAVGDRFIVYGSTDIAAIEFIRVTNTATLSVEYYR